MNALERTLALVLPPLAAAGIVWGSSVPLTLNTTSGAVLRLAWAVRPERIETCRDLSSEELANVPQHMRQARICEGTPAEYRLVVRDASGVRLDRIVRGGGLRQDRRLYVLEELSLTPGPSLIDVRFERVTHPASGDDDSRYGHEGTDHEGGDENEDSEENEDDEGGEEADDDRNARQQGAVPPRLALVTPVTARPREVVLVTYDETRRALVALQSSEPADRDLWPSAQ